ncbi:MAG TPA: hypothetical protein P5235_02015 [Saprospiraceae bacterium]|nr:hypothetical protein [Lewinellaceae bacterium]HRX28134.1 hypothetical protein [Saprospiraceae bacterium]
MKRLFALLMLLNWYSNLIGQNLESISKKPLSLSGNLAIGSSFYHTNDTLNTRSPFAYFINANPTFKIFGFDVPVSFSYRNHEGTISNPFARVSINPRYKWIGLHLGNSNYSYHEYVLSGQYINGVGLDLTPGKFIFSMAYGKMENPLNQIDTIIGGSELVELYDRKAIALKLGFGSSKTQISFSLLKAKDETRDAQPDSLVRIFKPAENFVAGTSLRITPFGKLSLYGNLAASLNTANQNSSIIPLSGDALELEEKYGDQMTINFSTKLQLAGDVGIDLKFKQIGFGVQYKRVDPFYNSLGTYYFLNDYENLLFKTNINLLKNKINFNGSFGWQRNNINDLRSQTNVRNIANVTLSIRPSRSFNTTFRYSNLKSDRSPGLVNLNDTLRYTRVNQTYGVIPVLILGSSQLVISANYQSMENLLSSSPENQVIGSYIGTLAYTYRFKKIEMNLGFNASGLQNEVNLIKSQRLGGGINVAKSFLDKKIRLSTNVSYFKNFINDIADGNTATARLGINASISSSSSITLNTSFVDRQNTSRSYQEIRGTAKVNYVFNNRNSNKNEKDHF